MDEREILNGHQIGDGLQIAIQSYGTEPVAEEVTVVSPAFGTAPVQVIPLLPNDSETSTVGNAEPVFQDVPFAILFLFHLGIMLWLGAFVAPKGYENIEFEFNMTSIESELAKDGDITEEDIKQIEEFAEKASEWIQVYPYRIVMYLVFPGLLIAYVISSFMTAFLIRPCAKAIVYSVLIGSLLSASLIMLSLAIVANDFFVYLLSGISLVSILYYVRIAWRMVPFAAVNLKIALEGIGKNWAMYIVAFAFSQLGFIWNIYWLYVLVGLGAYENEKCMKMHPEANMDDDTCDPPVLVLLLFLVSLYWTTTVLMNTVQVTTAGVMATWCFVSNEAEHCCSPAVSMSLFRSLTYSFGSICFGSLLQAITTALRNLAENARSRREHGDQGSCETFCFCIIDCLIQFLDEVLEYFNQWAYCYIGIYGLSYFESGKRVIELFRARGWTSIVTDNLVGYTLGFFTFVVGFLSGLMGMIIEHAVSSHHQDVTTSDQESYLFGAIPGATVFSFLICFLVGVWVSSVMMNVVNGAVNTLIVCWADSPAKLEAEHPMFTAEMADAWTSVFPEIALGLQTRY